MDINIVQAIEDQQIFGRLFKDIKTWRAWMTYLRALFGLPSDLADMSLFKECTGLASWPSEKLRESFVIAGRRSGKSYVSALIAVFLGCLRDWRPYLAPGEKGWIFIIAVDKLQARVVKNYIQGILHGSKFLKSLIEKETAEEIYLKNNVVIAIKTSSFRTVRGYTLFCAILEEIAFWRSEESANPDREILAAVRPALATIPESLLIGISTPYSRGGALWEQYRTNFGKPGQTLIWKAASELMNPTLDKKMIERSISEDPEAARAEWLAEWRSDIAAFLSEDAVRACVVPDRHELEKIGGIEYFAFADPSGGRQDSFTLAIAHREQTGKVILDLLRERVPPFRPEATVEEFSDTLKSFGISSIESDRFAGEWVTDSFKKFGIEVKNSEQPASELYLELLPKVTQGSVELLDNKRLISQLASLERRTRSGGKDLITHYAGGHDDCANAAAGACIMASKPETGVGIYFSRHSVFPNDSARADEDEGGGFWASNRDKDFFGGQRSK